MLDYKSFRYKLCINDTKEADITYHVYLLLNSETESGSINIVNTNIGLTAKNKLLFHCLVRLENIFKKVYFEQVDNKICVIHNKKYVSLVLSTKDNCAASLTKPTYGIFLLDEKVSNSQKARLSRIREQECSSFKDYIPLIKRLGISSIKW